jgi:hypothetical protein
VRTQPFDATHTLIEAGLDPPPPTQPTLREGRLGVGVVAGAEDRGGGQRQTGGADWNNLDWL